MFKTRTVSLRPWLTFVLSIWTVFFPDLSASQSLQDTSQSERAETHAQAGIQSAQAGNISWAESELRNAVALAPSNVEWLRNLATILAMERKFEESTVYFQRALKIDPKDAVARRYIAANLWQMHRFAEARQNLRILLSANPRDPDALLLLGMVAENTKDYATAAKVLASVPALVRARPESIAALARSYYHVGESEKARAWLRELQNHAAGVKALLLGAQIADEMRDYEAAEALLSSAEERYSDQADLKYWMALVKFHARRFEESEQILQRLVDDGQKTSEVDRLLASCYRAQGRDDDAIRALQEAIQLDPANEASYLDLSTILLTKKRISAPSRILRAHLRQKDRLNLAREPTWTRSALSNALCNSSRVTRRPPSDLQGRRQMQE
jgi:Tfp pilus assembly protein PilF